MEIIWNFKSRLQILPENDCYDRCCRSKSVQQNVYLYVVFLSIFSSRMLFTIPAYFFPPSELVSPFPKNWPATNPSFYFLWVLRPTGVPESLLEIVMMAELMIL